MVRSNRRESGQIGVIEKGVIHTTHRVGAKKGAQ
jgi:hypothetical protein